MLYPSIMNDFFINCDPNMWDICGAGPTEGPLSPKKFHMTTTVFKPVGVDGGGRGHIFMWLGLRVSHAP